MSVADLCVGLRRGGIDVQLAYSSKGGRARIEHPLLPCRLLESGVPMHDIQAMVRSPSPAKDARALVALRSLIRRERPTVVHTHMSKAGLLGRIAAMMERVPAVVHTLHGWPVERSVPAALRSLYLWTERQLARRTDRLVAVTPRLIRDSISLEIGRESSFRVIRCGVNLAAFRAPEDPLIRFELGIPREARVIGGVMSLVPEKCPLDFVSVCARVADTYPDAHFVLVGDGPLRADVACAVNHSAFGGRFHLLGLRVDIPRLLHAFDALLLTSATEGLPRVIMEASVGGIPVVATDVGGVSELIENGITGFLAPAGEIEMLATHIDHILRDPCSAQNLASAASSRVSEGYDVTAVVAQHRALYQECVEEAYHRSTTIEPERGAVPGQVPKG
jgi:glycosyltransferase involved in cell wall biosynthesis